MIDYNQKFRLDSKTAYVFGGVGLIGKEISIAYALAGANVIILDIDEEKGINLAKELTELNTKAYFKYFDCSETNNVESNFSKLTDEFGCPEIFINCSYPRTKDWSSNSFKELSSDSFRKNIDIHLNSHSLLVRRVAEELLNNKLKGSLIQLGSIYGLLGQDLNIYKDTEMSENMTYSIIKGGIINLTRQMASYYGQYNIRVNTLTPGGIVGHVAGENHQQNSTFINNYSEKNPLKRLGNSHEIASTALFLASEASSYINGANIVVDGGWSIV